MSLPCVWINIFFITGIIFGRYLHPTPFFLLWIATFIFPLFLLRRKRRLLVLSIIALWGAFLSQKSSFYSSRDIASLSPAFRLWVIGRIVKPPINSSLRKRSDLILQVEKVKQEERGEWREDVKGLVKVNVYNPPVDYHYGEKLLLYGRLHFPHRFGRFDYKRYLWAKGIYSLLSVQGKNVRVLEKEKTGLCLLYQFREKWTEAIEKYLSLGQKRISGKDLSKMEEGRKELLKALLIGERANLPSSLRKVFINTGTMHILSISGLHIGIVAGILLFLFKFLRLPYKITYFITPIFIGVYVLISGARVPAIRAAILAAIILWGRILNYPTSFYNSLSFASFVILLNSPLSLFEPGFQFSFLCVFFILYLSPKIKRSLQRLLSCPDMLRGAFLRKPFSFFISSLAVSLSAWLGVLPLVSYYFQRIVPITVIANLIVVPLLFLIVASGFLLLFFSFFSFFALLFALIEIILLTALIKTLTFLSSLPFAHFYLSLTLFGVFVYYLCLLLISEGLKGLKEKGRVCLEELGLGCAKPLGV